MDILKSRDIIIEDDQQDMEAINNTHTLYKNQVYTNHQAEISPNFIRKVFLACEKVVTLLLGSQ